MPANTRSRQNKAKNNQTPSPIPAPDGSDGTAPASNEPSLVNQLHDELRRFLPQKKNSWDHECFFAEEIVHGIPELPTDALPSERQADIEAKVLRILDALGVEATPWAVFRMGKMSEDRPHLTKVILPSRSHYYAVPGRARSLKEMCNYRHIFIRASLTEAERKKEYDLRQEVRNRNHSLCHGECVVYKGEVVKVLDIPSLRRSQRMSQASFFEEIYEDDGQFSERHRLRGSRVPTEPKGKTLYDHSYFK
ncbi:hypothetical protein ANCDUO_00246 [Ancylostoma duodenale]|uniref:Uncharacterized protein n=1 Tax=Ancylostoma duodenale TaxID=51022 RepID=A0A0C2H6D4_9BILA|nr:hypothetical protein ANCDUO_00246 [Ancylostoma duodenale]